MTSMDYWPAGQSASQNMGLSVNQISSHLAADWVPSISAVVGPTLMSWPRHLIESSTIGSTQRLCLKQELGSTDRQWKSMVSWMLGVACTRHVLDHEGYIWVAPLSAFYPNLATPVTSTQLPTQFASSTITAVSNPAEKARLMPDYLALRPRAGGYDWALVEAKGTSMAIDNRGTCPKNWHSQARNAVVKDNGTSIPINRHLVIAARVCPNGKRQRTRQLQVRCWNSEKQTPNSMDSMAVLDVVSAHLYGLLVNLGLARVGEALALATRNRNEEDAHPLQSEANIEARAELEEHVEVKRQNDGRWGGLTVRGETAPDWVEFGLESEAVNLIDALLGRDQNTIRKELIRIAVRNSRRLRQRQEEAIDSLIQLPAGFRVRIHDRHLR